jgi:hypothetical protein
MTCYCKERVSNPKLAEEMKGIPIGYCGLCDICGKPGHMRAHPRLPTTGRWCDEHWNELMTYRIITFGDIAQYVFYTVIIGISIYSIVSAWKVFF